MSKKQYVYVTLDPLLEEVVCVHKKENSTCDKCERLMKRRKGSYQPITEKFLIKD